MTVAQESDLRFVPRRSRGGVPTASRRTPNTCLSVWSARCLLRRMFRLRAVGAQGPPLNAESFDWRVAAQRQGVCYLRFLESTFVLRVLIRRGALALIRGSDVLRGFVCAKQRSSTVCLRRCFGRRVSSRRSPQDSLCLRATTCRKVGYFTLISSTVSCDVPSCARRQLVALPVARLRRDRVHQ